MAGRIRLCLLAVRLALATVFNNGSWKLSYPPWGEVDSPMYGKPELFIPIMGPITRQDCMINCYIAMRIAASHLNRRDATLCPAIAQLRHDFEVRYELRDTHSSGSGAVLAAMNILKADTQAGKTVGSANARVKVVLGPDGSPETMGVYPFLGGAFSIPYLSWAATAASLSNKDAYPYFFRVVAPDSATMDVQAGFIHWLGYDRVNILHMEDGYATGQAVDFISAATVTYKMQVEKFSVPQSSGSYGTSLNAATSAQARAQLEIIKNTNVRVIGLYGMKMEIRDIFLLADQLRMSRGTGWLWFGGDGMAGTMLTGDPAEDAHLMQLMEGTIYVMPDNPSPYWEPFQTAWKADVPSMDDPEFTVQKVCQGETVCQGRADFAPIDRAGARCLDGYTREAYVAMVTMAVVADRLITSTGKAPCDLTKEDWYAGLRALTASPFTCLSGPMQMNARQERASEVSFMQLQVGGSFAVEVSRWSAAHGYRWVVGAMLKWADGTEYNVTASNDNVTVPSGRPPTCPAGEAYSQDTLRCEVCPVGYAALTLNGVAVCTCAVGYGLEGGACLPCAPGRGKGQAGDRGCTACEPGRASGGGARSCQSCGLGTFASQPGQTSCSPCARGYTTFWRGAANLTDCVCEEGYYNSEASGSRLVDCDPCPKGMHCARGNVEPVLRGGFWASSSDSETRVYSIYRCRDALECPGGPAGICASGREGVGCAKCMPDHHAVKGGRCERCAGTTWVPIVLACLGVLAVLAALALYAQQDATRVSQTAVAMRNCLTQAVTVMQTLAVLGVLKVSWVDPFATLLRGASILNFEPSLVLNNCAFPDTEAVAKHVLTLLTFPICTAALCVIFLCMKLLGRAVSSNHAFNSVGQISLLLFLPLTMAALEPFHCISSPNGLMTLQADPSIVCLRGGREWPWLAAFGALTLLVYSAGFFSWTTWTSLRYKYLIADEGGPIAINRYRFIFQRFTVECYYFCPIFLTRSLCITLVPVVFPDHGHRQVLMLSLVLGSFGFFHVRLQPWRGFLPNVLDGVIVICFVVLMNCATLLMETERDVVRSDTQLLLTGTMAVMLAALLVICSALLLRRARPGRRFAAFLCHHKVGCAAGARLMKSELTQRLGASVFLDSDELDDLEDVLEIVRSSVHSLVVLLTAQTLSRPWCAAEISTAFSNGVHIIPVRYDDYVELTDEDLDEKQIEGRWPAEAFAGYAAHGVSLASVKEAYTHLQGLEKIPCMRVAACIAGEKGASAKAADAVARRHLDYRPRKSHVERQRREPSSWAIWSAGTEVTVIDVAVIADNTDPEAISAAEMLSRLIRRQTEWSTLEMFDPRAVELVAAKAIPKHVVLLLTNGALSSPGFARTLLSAWDAWGDQMNVALVMMERCALPASEALSRSIIPQVSETLSRDEAEIASVYTMLLSLLVAPFSPSSQISVLDTEVARITRRLQRQSKHRGPSSASTAPRGPSSASTAPRGPSSASTAPRGPSSASTTPLRPSSASTTTRGPSSASTTPLRPSSASTTTPATPLDMRHAPSSAPTTTPPTRSADTPHYVTMRI